MHFSLPIVTAALGFLSLTQAAILSSLAARQDRGYSVPTNNDAASPVQGPPWIPTLLPLPPRQDHGYKASNVDTNSDTSPPAVEPATDSCTPGTYWCQDIRSQGGGGVPAGTTVGSAIMTCSGNGKPVVSSQCGIGCCKLGAIANTAFCEC